MNGRFSQPGFSQDRGTAGDNREDLRRTIEAQAKMEAEANQAFGQAQADAAMAAMESAAKELLAYRPDPSTSQAGARACVLGVH